MGHEKKNLSLTCWKILGFNLYLACCEGWNYSICTLNKYELHNRTHIETIPVTETEVINIIRALKPKGTGGYDGISNNNLKLCAHIISKPLT